MLTCRIQYLAETSYLAKFQRNRLIGWGTEIVGKCEKSLGSGCSLNRGRDEPTLFTVCLWWRYLAEFCNSSLNSNCGKTGHAVKIRVTVMGTCPFLVGGADTRNLFGHHAKLVALEF